MRCHHGFLVFSFFSNKPAWRRNRSGQKYRIQPPSGRTERTWPARALRSRVLTQQPPRPAPAPAPP